MNDALSCHVRMIARVAAASRFGKSDKRLAKTDMLSREKIAHNFRSKDSGHEQEIKTLPLSTRLGGETGVAMNIWNETEAPDQLAGLLNHFLRNVSLGTMLPHVVTSVANRE